MRDDLQRAEQNVTKELRTPQLWLVRQHRADVIQPERD